MSLFKLVCIFLLMACAHITYAQLNENFDDNRNRWSLSGDNESKRKIENGKYVLTTLEDDKGKFTQLPVFFDPNKDFVLEAAFTQISGADDNGIGLYWGQSYNLYNEFIFTSNGYYRDRSGSHKWIKTDLVQPMGKQNTIRIEQKGNTTRITFNGTQVISENYTNYGFFAGFVNYARMVLEVDYIRLEQENKINLIADLPTQTIKENLGTGINTYASELGPIISADGKSLYFDRTAGYEYNTNGKADLEDVWVSSYDGKKWKEARNLTSINTKDADNSASVSTDENILILSTKNNFKYFKRKGRRWQGPYPYNLPFVNESKYMEAQLAADGKAFFLSIKTPDNISYNKDVDEKDIYVALKDDNDKWGPLINLGPTVNSPGNENGPFLAADGRTLYFSTNGRPGYGDNDIFMTKRIGDGWTTWTEPVNLGPQINTPDFDAYYVVSAAGDYAYVVSNENSVGKADIFRMKLPNQAKPNPVVLVFGKTLNVKNKKPVEATIELDNLQTGKEVAEAISDSETGEYKVVLPFGANYGLHAAAPGYLSVNENMELAHIREYTEIEKNLYLLKIEVGETLQLNNVFFEQGKAVLKTESYPELDRLAGVLKENQNIHIELGGHTDNVGPAAALLKLSDERVQAVKKYLVGKGIASGRITGKGYGSTQPIEKNDTEENRKKNRRVEFKITKS
ncbi:MAG: OmpA family protein [Bacteroidetes bacterium]|nr:OmpA family protein [Bacteroidota bacterium]MBS1541113.1 OmpA family protein [Bacteroidota bacterium]